MTEAQEQGNRRTPDGNDLSSRRQAQEELTRPTVIPAKDATSSTPSSDQEQSSSPDSDSSDHSATHFLLLSATSRLGIIAQAEADEPSSDEFDFVTHQEEAENRARRNRLAKMAPEPTTQVFIDGTFEDLAEELAVYLDNEKKTTAVRDEIKPLLEANQKDEVLKKLVVASAVLNSAPEKEFTAAYNLLIYLVIQSPNVNNFLQKVCENLSRPVTSSPQNGPGLALAVLSTLFNLLPAANDVRSNVFSAILRLVKQSGSFEVLKPQLKKLDLWIQEWDMDEEDQRKLFVNIAEVAKESGEDEESYNFILRALRTYSASDSEEISSKEAQDLSLRALKAALVSPTHYDFHDLTSLAPVQALSESHPEHAEILEIVSEKELEDYNDFNDEHDDFLEKNDLDNSKIHRKMRLLTLASLAASTSSRELEYKRISKALQIPSEDVEMWVIDVIRAGLVEGKLSQQRQMFLVHRTTYRVFGDKQWREVANRLDTWKESFRGILEVVRRERQAAEKQKENEMKETDRRANGGQGMGAGRKYGKQQRDDMVEVGTD